jgi:hypothetical protein
MKGVALGAVKFLRVVESPEKRFWTRSPWGGQGQEAPAMNWHDFNNKRILGTVPVEPDGSAAFAVPPDTFVYFQLLDENGMMIQSMRSGTVAQSGEWTGCVGCHEERRSAPPAAGGGAPMAMRRPPSRLEGWHGPPRLFSYRAEVQPVFDRACLSCHDFGTKGGEKLVLAGDRDLVFNASYIELWRKKYIRAVGAGPAAIQQAYSWGSHASKLAEAVRKRFKEGKVTREEFDRVVTWIDLNAPYYPSYASAWPDHLAGRSPLDDAELRRLEALVGVPFLKLASHDANRGPQISFDRPERSPCLARFKDPEDAAFGEALALIRAGRDRLRERPNPDADGFRACEVDRKRDEKYRFLLDEERRRRAAVRDGLKVYDGGGR